MKPELEAVYQSIFDRDLAGLGIPNTFYPLGGAANYSFLYLILRAAQEHEIRSIVELGAGQTTLLLDALRRKHVIKTDAIVTMENDRFWASHIGGKVTHEIKCVPLRATRTADLQYSGYDLTNVDLPSKIDLLLIDGPVGWGSPDLTFARLGALPILDHLNTDEGFLIVVDDAEREGEKALVANISSTLQGRGVSFHQGQVTALKRQVVFASGNMSAAAFY
ncbi:hypothetical protein XH91_27635 [Bradyrhizobium guangzhouense]|uniref:Uncharacterized protein n=1 Tax=Bradyrhizobium guangzhouense TaxID=1325095 RepID=A0AAE5X4J8_9BRAD|nr:hypothetical protein XH91_27635 [Bradyrhizobium guangzhouense]